MSRWLSFNIFSIVGIYIIYIKTNLYLLSYNRTMNILVNDFLMFFFFSNLLDRFVGWSYWVLIHLFKALDPGFQFHFISTSHWEVKHRIPTWNPEHPSDGILVSCPLGRVLSSGSGSSWLRCFIIQLISEWDKGQVSQVVSISHMSPSHHCAVLLWRLLSAAPNIYQASVIFPILLFLCLVLGNEPLMLDGKLQYQERMT